MTDTTTTAHHGVRIERGAKRVRAYLGGRLVADTTRPLLVWEKPFYPAYYLPADDVAAELVPTGEVDRSPQRGDGEVLDVRIDGVSAAAAAIRYERSPATELRDAVRLEWSAMDAWFEEDEQVFVHPRSPYTRIDILRSSRHVRVEAGGIVLADTTRPTLLFETGLPTRVYLPPTDVRMDLLQPSATVSHCPYKGQAAYWSVVAGGDVREDAAWSYPTPLPESEGVAGLLSFYPAKVDVIVDGVRQA